MAVRYPSEYSSVLVIPVLVGVTGALSAGYVAWLDVGINNVITARWAWGQLAGVITGAFLAFAITQQPYTRRLHGRELTGELAWEGVVYGAAEGVLLSALPAL